MKRVGSEMDVIYQTHLWTTVTLPTWGDMWLSQAVFLLSLIVHCIYNQGFLCV
jgi:hypothetical protein